MLDELMQEEILIKQDLWRLVANNKHTDFQFLFRPSQKILYKILKDKTFGTVNEVKRFVLDIGRRWGKSSFGWLFLAEKAYQKPNSHWLYLAPVNEKLESYLTKVVGKILIYAPKDCAPEYKNGKYIFPNGSTIECFGTTNESYLYIKGQSYDGVYMDEVGEMDDLQSIINDIISPTLFDSHGFLLIASAPGETPDHYFKTLCEEAQIGNYYFHATIYEAGYPLEWIKQELQDVAKGDEKNTTWRRQYLAEFVTESTRMVLNTWDSNKYIYNIPRTANYKYFYHYIAFDPGFKDPNSISFCTYLWDIGKLYIEDEIVIPGKEITPDKLAALIKTKRQELWQYSDRVQYWADPSNQTILDIFGKNYQLYFNWTAKDKKEQAIEDLRTFIQDGRLILDPKCVRHKIMFENTIWDKTHKDYERSNSGDHGDCVDTALYTFRNVDFSNPLPSLPPMNVEKEFITPANKQLLEEQDGLEDWITHPADDSTDYHNY